MQTTSTSSVPAIHADGTLSAIVLDSVPSSRLLRVWLPPGACETPICGRFWMARCAADTLSERSQDWSIYLRRPLIAAGIPTVVAPDAGHRIALLLGPGQDPGAAWLAARPPGTTINLIGPFGSPLTLPEHSRALLILTLPAYAPIWLPIIHDMLDRGGRVTLITPPDAAAQDLRPLLPLAVELRTSAADEDWSRHLAETLRWADHLCASLPASTYQPLADQLRQARFQVEPNFAHVLIESDLACGFGACLACVVPLPAGGVTRACLHGPIFPLERVTV